MVKPLAQQALRIAPGLRELVIQRRTPAERVALTGVVVRDSLRASLQRLRTDFVDVLALHEPNVADLEREDVRKALEDEVALGLARCIGVAGSMEIALKAASMLPVQVVQIANQPFAQNLGLAKKRQPAERRFAFVTHSVYGRSGALEKLTEVIGNEPRKRALLEAQGYRGASARAVAAEFLLDFALASNRDGVVLLSMYRPQHLQANLERLTASPPAETVLKLADQLRDGDRSIDA
jgi:aryl-alcohol dehydrogenase-like predicted oxidoreductase